MNNLLSIIPLLKVQDSGWLEQIMYGIRTCIIESSELSVMIATELAAIFCIAKLISLSQKIMSDNQMGGFGSIDLPEILVPLILFFCVQNFTTILRPLDDVCSKVSTALAKQAESINYEPDEFVKKVGDGIKKTDGEINKEPDGDDSKQNTSGDFLGKLWNTIVKLSPLDKLAAFAFQGIEVVICWIIDRIFEIERYVMVIYTNVHLSFLAFIGPLTFAFSIFEKWRNAYMAWISTFIEVSLWKIGISLVVMCVAIANSEIQINSDAMTTSLGEISFGNLTTSGTAAMLEAFWSVVVSIAGIKCLKRVPALIHMALNLSPEAGNSDSGGGNFAGAAGGAASAAARVGGKAAGLPV